MYFPYLRGRQYELLALKELAKDGLLSSRVLPVIEPVKLSSTFEGTLQTFSDTNSRLAIIFNPAFGDYAGQDTFVDEYIKKTGSLAGPVPALLMSNLTSTFPGKIREKGIDLSEIITVLDNRDSLETYRTTFENSSPRYTLFEDDRSLRRIVKTGKVIFEDKFNKLEKNADYSQNIDEFFSDDHLFYRDEGYKGFGDYTIIGNTYTEKGFAPRAVAFHIVYLNIKNELRVRHFTSDSNNDISDVAGKFREALAKYIKWKEKWQKECPTLFVNDKSPTKAMAILDNHWNNETYPGLPTLKKLSIMHHLELMGKFLDAPEAKA